MKVIIQDLQGRHRQILGVEIRHTVNGLKQKIYAFSGVSVEDQTLMYLGQQMVDDSLLSEYNILDG